MPVLEEGMLLFKEKLANEKSIDSTDDLTMPVLEEGMLLFKEKLANEKSIDSTDDLARRKIRRFS